MALVDSRVSTQEIIVPDEPHEFVCMGRHMGHHASSADAPLPLSVPHEATLSLGQNHRKRRIIMRTELVLLPDDLIRRGEKSDQAVCRLRGKQS